MSANQSSGCLHRQGVYIIKSESQFSDLPLPLSFARSRESKGCPNSRFDRGVGVRERGR